jgi:exodeoxyribonuclease X
LVPSVRVIDLETTGGQPSAHGVCEIGWQDVARDGVGVWQVTPGRGNILTHPGRSIPPVTAAVHHIIDSDVADAPAFGDVAAGVLRGPHVALAAHRASFEGKWCTPRLTGGLPWICTWKCALRVWPGAPSFSNQVLRYWRMPEGLDRDLGLPVHRAGPDAYVTAHHLRDMLGVATVEQLIAWSAEPGLLPRVPAGPNRKGWRELDDACLTAFAADRDEDIRFSARTEFARRGGAPVAVPPPAQPRLF